MSARMNTPRPPGSVVSGRTRTSASAGAVARGAGHVGFADGGRFTRELSKRYHATR